MISPRQIYDILLDYSNTADEIQEIIIGLTWTLCQVQGIGLCMSPGIPTRTLSWSGTLQKKPVARLAPWIKSWDNYEATVAMAAQFSSPVLVVIGTTLGMLIADVPAVFVGDRFASKIPMRLVHGIAASLFALLGVATLAGAGKSLGLG